MAPKKPISSSRLAAPAARLAFVDQAGGEIGVDRHLLARHGVEVEARGDFGDAARALGDDHEVDDHQDREDDDADDEIAAHHEVAERLDDVAGGVGALVPARQDEPRRGEVEREPQHGRDQQHGRKGGEFERRLDEQRRHQDQHRQDDRDGERHVEQRRRQRQDQDDQDRHHADGERDVAALEHRADLAQPRQRELSGRPPPPPPRPSLAPIRPRFGAVVGMKRLHGERSGRSPAREEPRPRPRSVPGSPPQRDDEVSPAKFAWFMVSDWLTAAVNFGARCKKCGVSP